MNISFSPQTTPRGKHQDYSHFADEETEAQRVNKQGRENVSPSPSPPCWSKSLDTADS